MTEMTDENETVWLGIDLGTQSVRALAVTAGGTVRGRGSAPLGGRREGGRHEQDPGEWWEAVRTASRSALLTLTGVRIGGLAVCGTSGTVLLTDAEGRPTSPALMYDDARAAGEAARLREAGLAVQDTWALPKALWLVGAHGKGRVTHQPDIVTARLVGRPVPTDSSHALKTGYDLERDAWPDVALDLPDVVLPGTRLGEVCPAAAEATGIPAGTPVVAGMTDGCAAQIAAGALRHGSWNSVLGTTLVLKGAAPDPVRDPTGVVYNHRAPGGTWLPGGASSVGAGALPADVDPVAMDERAAAFEPSGAVAYPLVSRGERFPFLAPDATPSSSAPRPTTPTAGPGSSRASGSRSACAWTTSTTWAPRSTAPSPSPAARPAARTGTSSAPTSSAARPAYPNRPNRPWEWPRWRCTAPRAPPG